MSQTQRSLAHLKTLGLDSGIIYPENIEDFTALRGSHRGQGRQRGTVPRSPYTMSAVLT
jgi:hypothetical protein